MEALNHGIDIDAPIDARLNTKLMFAASKGDKAMVQCLIAHHSKRVNLNAQNDKRQTALILACKSSSYEVYSMLYDKGAIVNDDQCFKYCMSKNKPNVLIFNHLFSHGHVITYRTHKGLLETFIPVYLNSDNRDDDILNSLCVIIDQFDSVYPYALRSKNAEFFAKVAREFVPQVNDLIVSYRLDSFTEDILAVWELRDNFEYISTPNLLDAIYNVNLKSFQHFLAYLKSLKTRKPECNVDITVPVNAYIHKNISLPSRFSSFQTLYYYGYLNENVMKVLLFCTIDYTDNVDRVKWIVEKGVDINFNHRGRTFVGQSFREKSSNILAYLLSQGAKVDTIKLINFVNQDNIKILIPFISKQVLFEIVSSDFDSYYEHLPVENYSSFLKYCLQSRPLISSRFLALCVEKNITCDSKFFHEYYLRYPYGCSSLLFSIFKDHLNELNSTGTYLLYVMCKKGFTEEIESLLAMGANPNVRTLKGKTALYASKTVAITQMLITNGATLDVQCNVGNTPLMNCVNKFNKNRFYYAPMRMSFVGVVFRESVQSYTFDNYVLYLLTNGANISKCNSKGQSFSSMFCTMSDVFDYEVKSIMASLQPRRAHRTNGYGDKSATKGKKKVFIHRETKTHLHSKEYSSKTKRPFVYACRKRTKD